MSGNNYDNQPALAARDFETKLLERRFTKRFFKGGRVFLLDGKPAESIADLYNEFDSRLSIIESELFEPTPTAPESIPNSKAFHNARSKVLSYGSFINCSEECDEFYTAVFNLIDLARAEKDEK